MHVDLANCEINAPRFNLVSPERRSKTKIIARESTESIGW